MSGPLEDLRIVDLSRIVAGPLATQILGDYGAEVIKVEHPQGGDDSRQWAPPRAPDGQASYFFAVNRGKRSITIDLKHPRGKALVLDLVRRGDVLIENFKPGTMDDLGLGWETLAERQPAADLLRDLRASERPDRTVSGRDTTPSCRASPGLMSITGESDGAAGQGGRRADRRDHGALRPRRDPRGAAPPGPDRTGPVPRALAHGVRHRRADQRGDGVPGGRGGAGTLGERASVAGAVPGVPGPGRLPHGRRRQRAAVEGVLRGARRAGVGRRPALRTRTPSGSRAGRSWCARSRRVSRRGDRDEWVARFAEAGLPAGPINDIGQVFEDPQVRHREMAVEVDHPTAGRIRLPGIPVKFGGTPAGRPGAAAEPRSAHGRGAAGRARALAGGDRRASRVRARSGRRSRPEGGRRHGLRDLDPRARRRVRGRDAEPTAGEHDLGPAGPRARGGGRRARAR